MAEQGPGSTARPTAAETSGTDRRELAAAVVLVAVGGGLAFLGAARTWSTVTVLRAPPLGPVAADVTGRTLQPAVTGLAVVALAGVLAMLATRGVVRRLVGAVLTLAGLATMWRAALGLRAVSSAHGRTLVADSRTGATLGTVRSVSVSMHPVWALVGVLGGVLILLGGVVTAVRGGRWRAMSARYESPAGRPASADASTRTAADPGDGGAGNGGLGNGAATNAGLGNGGADGSAGASAISRADNPAGGRAASAAAQAGDPAAEVARARADLALWLQLDRGEDPTAAADEHAEFGYDQADASGKDSGKYTVDPSADLAAGRGPDPAARPGPGPASDPTVDLDPPPSRPGR